RIPPGAPESKPSPCGGGFCFGAVGACLHHPPTRGGTGWWAFLVGESPMRIAILAVPAALLLAGCASSPLAQRVEPIDGVVSGQCHADMVRGAVGLAASGTTIERARIDSDSTEVLVVRGQGDRAGS